MITTLTKDELLKRIKETVLTIDPDATVMLYGSRARGDAQPDSDWDILVLTDQDAQYTYQTSVWNAIYGLELECGEDIAVVIVSRKEWDNPNSRYRPFNRNVLRDGHVL